MRPSVPGTEGRPEAGSAGRQESSSRGAPDRRLLWHGRFSEGPSEELVALGHSLSFDARLAADDVEGSIAHVGMLAKVGLLSDEEASIVVAALRRAGVELGEGTFRFLPVDEDIHTAVERRVVELAGPVGGRLHTGRSRNDQVALDLRLFVRREGVELGRRIHELQRVLVRRATEAGNAYLPGYTHLQRAQPVLLAHHLLAHVWALGRDVGRLRDALHRADRSPLGAGALAGSSLPLDPEMVASTLGFAGTFDNSLDAVSDRDFVAELIFVGTLTQVHLSRIGEEVVIWSSSEFGFLRLADAYSTGSSMLPQKKNPDIAELVRGKAGRLIGNLTGLLATLKGLPLAYNRDLQEDKEPLFDTLDTLRLCLPAMTGLLASSTFDLERMRRAADTASAAAADLVEELVRRGMPFREAHVLVGGLVRHSIERGVPLEELVATEPHLGPEAVAALAPGAPVRRRVTHGGGGIGAVAAQLTAAGELLAEQEAWLGTGTPR